MSSGLRILGLVALAGAAAADHVDCDICIYGGTSGGVAAAVQAARMGKTAVLVEPGRHLGGMTSGGLGRTDTGSTDAIGGIGDEFYLAIGARYGGGRKYTFEPHVAEEVFNEWIATAGVPVYRDSPLDSVRMDGPTILSLTTTNGHQVTARMFIDASYEGDLMARAGVSYTVGREANSQYGETLNGVRGSTPSHQFAVGVDPYLTPGDPGSGLLPHIQPGDGGTPGSGDARVQAYNFRLCLTQDPANRIEIGAPDGYDPAEYELLGRYAAARVAAGHTLTLGSFLKIDTMPNGKTDINNQGAFSTDFIGGNYDYPDGAPETRARIRAETLRYTHGLLHFLGHDPRIPAAVRSSMLAWGLCRDEFQDTGGWPHQLYVREARRMVSSYVMTELNCRGLARAPHSVGLGSYNMDSHNVQRVVQGGVARNEGDTQVGVPGPYPIAYASIVPAPAECDNLLVTFCLSATHIAFGSIRMEPVLMVLSQSAATAAAFAIDDAVPIQQVDPGKLSLQLLADGQVLSWGAAPVDPGDGIMADSEDPSAQLVGTWPASSSVSGFAGTNYLHDDDTAKGTKSVTLLPTLPEAGDYQVYLRWTAHENRASNVPVTVIHDGGSHATTVDQRANGGQWVPLGVYPFPAGTGAGIRIETTGTDGYVVADAALWVPEGGTIEPDPPRVLAFASDRQATEGLAGDPARITLARTGDTAAPLTVQLQVAGTATPGADYPAIPASVTFESGQATRVLSIFPPDDATAEGDESVVLEVAPDPAYQPGSPAPATVTLHDAPFDGWRFNHFSPPQLADPAVSGADADPDGDATPNLGEFFAGGDPWHADSGVRASLSPAGEGFQLDVPRNPAATALPVTVETSTALAAWLPAAPAPPLTIVRDAPRESLRFDLAAAADPARFWRVRVGPAGSGTAVDGVAFHSFDTVVAGTGQGTRQPTLLAGFAAPPVLTQHGSVLGADGAGGASSFAGPDGNVWLGSGGASTPGHSLVWNPGSTGNRFVVQLSTLGQRDLTIRFDIRSAHQAGGSAPTAFSAVTCDTGTGAQPVPGAPLAITADARFHEWSADLAGLDAIEDAPNVVLAWEFEDLAPAPSPAESVRIDNLVIRSTAIPQ